MKRKKRSFDYVLLEPKRLLAAYTYTGVDAFTTWCKTNRPEITQERIESFPNSTHCRNPVFPAYAVDKAFQEFKKTM